jgi:hypothetical protein
MNHYEMIFVQFLHLLAHHPDFAITQESLPDMAKYAPNLFTTVLPRDVLTQVYRLLPRIGGFCGKRLVIVPPLRKSEDRARLRITPL